MKPSNPQPPQSSPPSFPPSSRRATKSSPSPSAWASRALIRALGRRGSGTRVGRAVGRRRRGPTRSFLCLFLSCRVVYSRFHGFSHSLCIVWSCLTLFSLPSPPLMPPTDPFPLSILFIRISFHALGFLPALSLAYCLSQCNSDSRGLPLPSSLSLF